MTVVWDEQAAFKQLLEIMDGAQATKTLDILVRLRIIQLFKGFPCERNPHEVLYDIIKAAQPVSELTTTQLTHRIEHGLLTAGLDIRSIK